MTPLLLHPILTAADMPVGDSYVWILAECPIDRSPAVALGDSHFDLTILEFSTKPVFSLSMLAFFNIYNY